MKELWNDRLTMPNHDLTPTGRMKRPSIAEVGERVKQVWDSVRPEIVVKSFRKYSLGNALDGTEDDA